MTCLIRCNRCCIYLALFNRYYVASGRKVAILVALSKIRSLTLSILEEMIWLSKHRSQIRFLNIDIDGYIEVIGTAAHDFFA